MDEECAGSLVEDEDGVLDAGILVVVVGWGEGVLDPLRSGKVSHESVEELATLVRVEALGGDPELGTDEGDMLLDPGEGIALLGEEVDEHLA